MRTPGRARPPPQRLDRPAESVGQDEVLEAHAGPELKVREQRPPIDRAATSITQARPSRTRSSAWTGPSVSPSALVAACVAGLTAVKSAPEP